MNKIIKITFFCFIVIFLIATAIKVISYRCEYFYSSFNGIIKDVEFTEQKLISVKLTNGDWHYLGTNIIYKYDISIGDSIIKESNTFDTFLYKGFSSYNIKSNSAGGILGLCKCFNN